MCLNNLMLILYFVFAARFCIISAQICGDSLYFIPNGTYDANRHLALSSLASKVSAGDGFYNISVGEGPESIYVMGLCIPGTEPKVCSNCIEGASIALTHKCLNETDSFEWRGDKTLCFVRYSNHTFFDEIDLKPYHAEYYTGDIPGNVTEFNRIWEDLMKRMIVAASSSTPGSPVGRHYAADMVPLTGFINLYALMQCIPGISSGECYNCLLECVRTQQQCCSKQKGSAVRRPVCYSLIDTSPFLGAFDNITSSPPPQPIPPPGDLPKPTKKDGKGISARIIIAIVIPAAIIAVLLALGFTFYKRRKSYKNMKFEIDDDKLLQYDLRTIEDATNNFSDHNKLGKGGFGVVYKGKLSNGTEIAVKKLSLTSNQGLREFKNEVIVVAKLQHNNLVKLVGFCYEREEKILVYEFLSNKSLDVFLFDTTKQHQLDWSKRYNIIEGIARGMLYLHRDSRLKIIHRDLKASNILLDADMEPKIADFGLAKIFEMEQTRAETNKIAGTFGYMAPEYVMHGRFSMKSDVYSFGVLVLEIISGKINSSFNQTDGSPGNLVSHAWRLWREGSALELLDPTFGENYPSDEVTRCIHVALLCVEKNPEDRPMMCKIILMLSSSTITLQKPREPGFFFRSARDRGSEADDSNSFGKPVPCSINYASISDLDPR